MRILAGIAGFLFVALALADAFITIVLTRRTRHTMQLARGFYRLSWSPFSATARHIASGPKREEFLSIYGPLSLLLLLAIWAACLILGFGLLQWSVGMQPAQYRGSLGNDIYISATTLFTLSTGDPRNPVSRVLSACEGGLGLSFLGLVIAYLPILYQSFSRRELRISLLDARAGSPPSASALLYSAPRSAERLERQLVEWEEWAAELLENQLSFPVLAYFRSHHANQSWLAALVAILDAVSVVMLCSEDDLRLQARLTFAMGRHALADIAALFPVQNTDESVDRLPHQDFLKLGECLSDSGSPLLLDRLSEGELAKLRKLYETHAAALSGHLLVALPPWIGSAQRENWKRTAADPRPDPFAVSDPFSGRRA